MQSACFRALGAHEGQLKKKYLEILDDPRQSSNQLQSCYQFSRCASAAALPTIGDCKALNKLCRQVVGDPMELMFWPLQGDPRLVAMPDAAFRNNSDKSSRRAMVIFMAGRVRTLEGLWFSLNQPRSNEQVWIPLLLSCMRWWSVMELVKCWQDSSRTTDTEDRSESFFPFCQGQVCSCFKPTFVCFFSGFLSLFLLISLLLSIIIDFHFHLLHFHPPYNEQPVETWV